MLKRKKNRELSKYHKDLISGLERLAKSKGYYEERTPKYSALPITAPTRPFASFGYYPDFWINSSRRGILFIFEIFDDELNDKNLMIADLIQCYLANALTKTDKKIIIIAPTKKDSNDVKILFNIIRKILIYLKTKKDKIPSPKIYAIPKRVAANKKALDKILNEYSRKHGWESLGEK